MPVRQMEANLYAQVALFGGAFVGVLALLGQWAARISFRSEARADAWLCFVALLFSYLAVASEASIHLFLFYGQPYGPSGLLAGLGLMALLTPERPRPHVWGLALPALLLAGGFNPSLLVIGTAALAVLAWLDPARRRRILIVAPLFWLSCGVWLLAARLLPGSTAHSSNLYAGLSDKPLWWNVGADVTRILDAFDGATSAVAAWLTLALVLVLLRRSPEARRGTQQALLLGGFALLWLVAFANNAWVAGNDYHFRYFAPVILTIVLLLTLPIVALIRRLPHWWRLGATPLLLAGSLALVAARPQPLESYRTFARVAPQVAQAKAEGIHFFAGDYWFVWSAVFLLLREETAACGIDGLRDIANQDNVLAFLRQQRAQGLTPRAYCLDAPLARCVANAEKLTRQAWRSSDDGCGTSCRVLVLAE